MTMRRRLKLQTEPIRRPMIGNKSRLLTIFAVLFVLALGGCQNQTATDKSAEKEKAKTEKPASGMPGMMITKVSVITPSVRTVPITMTAAGTLASPNAVTLTPQVSGTIDAVHVQSGQQVEKGDLLFSLDAQPFETALLSARAKLEGDRAQARYAAQQVQQLKPLVEKEYVTRQSYEQAVATAMAANALIAQDEAAIQTAQINLAYTKIRAPITGRLGEISLQPGNLVVANNTALSTLVSNRELLVNFSLPQSVLQTLRKEWPGLGQTMPGE
ncbi:MAG: efflux RND transporter periplasmic adaptor subunit, partial [Halothiobacillus sp.]